MTGDIFWRAAVLRSNRKYEYDVVGDGERDFGWFLGKYSQDIAWITMEIAETCCTDRVWLTQKVGFAMSLTFLAPNAKFFYYRSREHDVAWHQNDIKKQGCATIQACATIQTNTVFASHRHAHILCYSWFCEFQQNYWRNYRKAFRQKLPLVFSNCVFF